MPAVGSSSRSSRGRPASAMASSSRFWSPCDSAPPGVAAEVAKPTRSSSSRARSLAIARAGRHARPRATAVREQRHLHVLQRGEVGEDAGDLEGAADAHAGQHVRRRPVTSCPSKTTRPPSARTRPVTVLKNVLFPAPFGPMMARNSPGSTSRVTPPSACTPPKSRRSDSMRSTGSAGCHRASPGPPIRRAAAAPAR